MSPCGTLVQHGPGRCYACLRFLEYHNSIFLRPLYCILCAPPEREHCKTYYGRLPLRLLGVYYFGTRPGYTSTAATNTTAHRDHFLHTANMAGRWGTSFSFTVLSLLVSIVSADHTFENTAIVRTVELGGSLVHVTTTYAVKALEDDSSIYTIALSEDEQRKTSWMQAKMKGETVHLELEKFGLNRNSCVSCSRAAYCRTPAN